MSSRRKKNQRIGVSEIQEGVELFNTDGNNLVNPFEIKEAMQILGLREKKPNLYSLIETLCNRKDIKKNGGLTVEEFVSFLEDEMNDTESDEGLTKLFNVYKDPKSETAPINNFCQVAKDVEDYETANDLKDAIDNSEMNGKEIDYDEFKEIMLGKDNNKNVYKTKKPSYTTTKIYTNKPITKEKEEKIETQPVYKYKKKDENLEDDNKDKYSKGKYSHPRIKIEKENTPKSEKPDIEIQKEIIIEKSEPVEYKKAADGKFYRVVNDDKNKEANNSVKIEITKQTEQEVDPDKKGKSSRVVIEKIITTEQVVEENVVEPGSSSNRYRYNKKKDNNPEVVEKEIEVTKEIHYPYKGRAVRPANNNEKVENKEEEQEDKKDDNDKRYHRRYRYNYSQSGGQNNNNGNNNNNNATNTGATSSTSYYRYRRKQ